MSRRGLLIGCTTLAILLTGAAFLAGNRWWGALLAAPVLILWLVFRGRGPAWLDMSLVLCYLGWVCLGVYLGLSSFLLIPGFVLALAAFELGRSEDIAVDEPLSDNASLFEDDRLKVLAGVTGLSLLLCLAGTSVSMRMPFFIMVVAAVAVLFGLYKFASTK